MTVWGTPGTPKKINIDQPSGDHCTPSSPDIAQSSSSDVLPARPCRAALRQCAWHAGKAVGRGAAAQHGGFPVVFQKVEKCSTMWPPPLQVGLNAIDHSIT